MTTVRENMAEDQTGEDARTAVQPVTSGPEMRASDAERAAAADRLHAAIVEGRLDIGETEERLAAVYAWLYSARVRGAVPARPDAAQRRAVTVVLAAAALWVIVCLLAGFAAGLLG